MNATHDDVNAAFHSAQVMREPDDRLIEYLVVLCTEQIRGEENRLLANNRCITINTILTQRLTKRIDRATTILTTLGIVVAVVGAIAAF